MLQKEIMQIQLEHSIKMQQQGKDMWLQQEEDSLMLIKRHKVLQQFKPQMNLEPHLILMLKLQLML